MSDGSEDEDDGMEGKCLQMVRKSEGGGRRKRRQRECRATKSQGDVFSKQRCEEGEDGKLGKPLCNGRRMKGEKKKVRRAEIELRG